MVMTRLINPHHKSPYADVLNVRFGFEFPDEEKNPKVGSLFDHSMEWLISNIQRVLVDIFLNLSSNSGVGSLFGALKK